MMKFNTKTRYALRTMIAIALEGKGKGLLQKEIARRQGISNKYLDAIIRALKRKSLIKNVRGKKSGYVLARPAGEISLYDIHLAFEKEINPIECLQPGYVCPNMEVCVARLFWMELNKTIKKQMEKTTLALLVREQRKLLLKKKMKGQ